jgi:hypothetical protein
MKSSASEYNSLWTVSEYGYDRPEGLMQNVKEGGGEKE